MDFTVNKLDVAFFQRNKGNSNYEQINISGSNAIFYLDAEGALTAGLISDVIKPATSKAFVRTLGYSPMSPGEEIFAVNTVTVGNPNRFSKYKMTEGSPVSYTIVNTETHTIDTPYGIAI